MDTEYSSVEQDLGVEVGHAHVDGVDGTIGRESPGQFGGDEEIRVSLYDHYC